MQRYFREAHAGIMVDCKFDKYQAILRKQQLANRLRSKWRVIQGGRDSSEEEYKSLKLLKNGRKI